MTSTNSEECLKDVEELQAIVDSIHNQIDALEEKSQKFQAKLRAKKFELDIINSRKETN